MSSSKLSRAWVLVATLAVSSCSTRGAQPAQPRPRDDAGSAPIGVSTRTLEPDAGRTGATDDRADVAVDAIEAGARTPDLPRGVVALEVPGFSPAAYAAPDASSLPPWRLIVILHGNFDRPEWECETWASQGRSRGWLLCPRGYPRSDAPPELDRWTYDGRTKLAQEVEAGVAALEAAHPGLVKRDDAVLIGFSLGAHMAPRFLGTKVLGFRSLVLAEGGYQVTAEVARSAARQGIAKVVYVCGERTICPARSKQLGGLWRRAGVEPATIVMPGVGHGYPDDVEPIARQTFEALGL